MKELMIKHFSKWAFLVLRPTLSYYFLCRCLLLWVDVEIATQSSVIKFALKIGTFQTLFLEEWNKIFTCNFSYGKTRNYFVEKFSNLTT